MNNVNKYTRQFFEAPATEMKWTKRSYVDKAPIWCSVDLRDGNQALIIPMSLGEKLEFFQMLVDIGFKEIEIGFPAASETEYDFCRTLIEQDLIPDDVTIQVLVQAREHLIDRTMEAVRGAKNVIVHLYSNTSPLHRRVVFGMDKEETLRLAEHGARMILDRTKGMPHFHASCPFLISLRRAQMLHTLRCCPDTGLAALLKPKSAQQPAYKARDQIVSRACGVHDRHFERRNGKMPVP